MDKIDWNQLRGFLETAETGSLSAAARKLGQTQPTLGRQVAALEQSLGVTLFERVGKAMVLTTTGKELLAHARLMGSAASDLEFIASGRSEALEGVVSVSACDSIASYLLPKILLRLRQIAPGIFIEVVPTDGISDLLRREADIAIRHVRPEQPELISRFVREASAFFYASESWVQEHGNPRTAKDIAQLDFIGADRSGNYLAFLQAHGLPVTSTNFRCFADNTATLWEMTRQGLGIGAQIQEIAHDTAGVVRVLEELPHVPFPIWLVTHRELRTARCIRVVFDFIYDALSN
jgi:DNA-binding transcriptional LysR family regulator